MSATNAPVGGSAGLSALPSYMLENFANWVAALVQQPLVRTPPLPPSAFIAIILTVAMFGIDTAASDWAHHLPRWFIHTFEEITNFGLGGRFLIPFAFVFLCFAAVAAPTLPRITKDVRAALAARFGFPFLAVGAPGLFDTIIKRLVDRARPLCRPAISRMSRRPPSRSALSPKMRPLVKHAKNLRNEGATGNLMRYLRLVLMSGVLFGACSCSELSGGLSVNLSKPEEIRCQVGPDCELKWERAYTWVVESSGLKLQTKTDSIIKTVQSPGENRTLVITITKNTTSQSGIYEIDFIGKCSSVWSCVPSAAESQTRFANFVSAAD
jgi:hypothetical protein